MKQRNLSPLEKSVRNGNRYCVPILKRMWLLILPCVIFLPAFIGGLCGHRWGVLMALFNLIAWLYFGLRRPMSAGSRIIWLLACILVLFVGFVECAYFFHWHLFLTSTQPY